MATWHDVTTAREQWVDAPLDDVELQELLDVAQDAVLAYAPSAEDIDPANPTVIPVRYRHAQLMQAQNVWNSSKASPSGDFDGGGFSLSTFPLDWQVKQVLRPRTIFGGPVA